MVRAARGQLLAWGLRLANRGRLPVTAAQATVVVPDLPGARPGCEFASASKSQSAAVSTKQTHCGIRTFVPFDVQSLQGTCCHVM